MRAIDCPCGHHLEATDDAELVGLCREHIVEHHPDMQRSDEQIREHIVEHHPDMQRSDEQIRERVTAAAYEAGVVA